MVANSSLGVNFTSWNLFFHVCKTRVIKEGEVYKAHGRGLGVEQTHSEPLPDRGMYFSLILKVTCVSF